MVRDKSLFSYTVEDRGYNGITVFVTYKGQNVAAFGTLPDGYNPKKAYFDSAMQENTRLTIEQLANHPSPAQEEKMAAIDVASDS